MTKDGQPLPVAKGKGAATLVITGKKISGNGGVNHYNGRAKITGKGGFKIGGVGATEMAGDPAAMKQEMSYFELLAKMTRYQIAKNTLTLSDDSGKNSLVFAPKGAPKNAPLIGTRWRFTGVEESTGISVSFSPDLSGGKAELTFGPKATVSGSGGINRFSGSAKITPANKTVAIGPLRTTRKGGPPEQMKQEQVFLGLLQKASRFELYGNRLALQVRDAQTRLLFEATP